MSRALLATFLLGCASGKGDADDATATVSGAPPPSTADLVVQLVPDDHPAAAWFDRFVVAFGVPLYAAVGASDDKALHGAHVLAQYLDNDADGVVDDPAVQSEMVARNAALLMFRDFDALESSDIFGSAFADAIHAQDLAADETNPPDHFDAALEEVLHLVHTAGTAPAHPEAFDMDGPSTLTDAMDTARGGHHQRVPDAYPDAAWYHYDDRTCDYNCQATEYLYWALTTRLDAQSAPGRCDQIVDEWEPCTPEDLQAVDTAISALLADSAYPQPATIPNGEYRR